MPTLSERTLVLLKPDAVRRGLVGNILARIESAGLAVVALKLVRPPIEHARGHYPMTDTQLTQMGSKTLATYAELGLDPISEIGTADAREIGLRVHEWNAEFLASGPVVACVVEGPHAVRKVRSICGATMPRDAAPGTIRGDFSSVSPVIANLKRAAVHNLVHASDDANDPDEPKAEIAHWFADSEVVAYEPVSWSQTS